MGLSDVVRGLIADEQSSDGDDRESPSIEHSSGTGTGTDRERGTETETGTEPGAVIYECRNCGTTVSPDETCPTCGSTAIAEYPVD
ncbi:hypothetical protein [Natronoglomus mannanivorans]|uniref:Zinc-ribbon domain-containing protein n=1 Tax=Natronoglomus mannanivorans TaxID=2979990 RepID=A0AAP2Z009_9EURY|nr:hypothetical protein [Halobacteria archaeon AArc-xg1-1]